MNVTAPAGDIRLQAICRFEQTLPNDMEVEGINEQYHPVIVNDCRQNFICCCLLQSTASSNIGSLVSIANMLRNEEEKMSPERDQPIIQLGGADGI